MTYRQIRIYTPDCQDSWAESVLGNVISPLVTRFRPDWFWITRYKDEHTATTVDFADSDGSNPPDWLRPEDGQKVTFRSIRFRCEIQAEDRSIFETSLLNEITTNKYWTSGWLDYDDSELSSDRFVGEDRSAMRRDERFLLTKDYLHCVSRLVLHSLIQAPSTSKVREYRFESNDHVMNPTGSTFFSYHHFFCNPTDVVVPVWVGPTSVNSTFTLVQLKEPLTTVRAFPLHY
jgi:hypothetical protein